VASQADAWRCIIFWQLSAAVDAILWDEMAKFDTNEVVLCDGWLVRGGTITDRCENKNDERG